MKRIFLVLSALLICVVFVGFYRGWFALTSESRDTESDKVDINLTVDRGKVHEDADKVKDKTKAIAHKVATEAKDLGGRARDEMKSK
jgi:hypothetical protein